MQLTRRELLALSAAAFADAPAGFPAGGYTPYGYLDNPYHSWDLHRSGVIRSAPGVGFGFLYPAGPGGYFDYAKNNVYESYLKLAFEIAGRRYREPADFGSALVATHHTKDLFVYSFAGLTAEFVLASEDALAARVTAGAEPVRVLALNSLRLGNASWWGRDGLSCWYDAQQDAAFTRVFAAGPVFSLLADRRSREHSNPATTYFPKPLETSLAFDLAPRETLIVVLARSANTSTALSAARGARTAAPTAISAKRDEDRRFWSAAPTLEGDWPAHWKHGWVYDFETLRMMVRRPFGVYKHPWDAMQIQAPRNVLAETSIDMWALSYADPHSAQDVFLGQFLDALSPNIPCMREDGVMNMVAVDGSECGTSISWCFPYFCAASIFDRTRDLAWLRALYPGLAALLRWTLANRRDSAGFLYGKCSWETGMDASRRFLIKQPTGGELTEFVRLVELQAAASQAAAILARFAPLAGDSASLPEWQRIQGDYEAKTQQLWRDDWFHDADARSNQLVTAVGRDPAQSAPAFCGIATADQMRRMVPTLRKLWQDRDETLAWSSLMLPYLESLYAIGEFELLADVVHATADRIYTSMDRRASGSAKLGWPGVSCEVWGFQGAYGGEGYGWGAVMPAHIIRDLIGLRETTTERRWSLCPNLPPALAVAGKRYALRFPAAGIDLAYTVLDHHRIRVEVAGLKPFEAENHRRYTIDLAPGAR